MSENLDSEENLNRENEASEKAEERKFKEEKRKQARRDSQAEQVENIEQAQNLEEEETSATTGGSFPSFGNNLSNQNLKKERRDALHQEAEMRAALSSKVNDNAANAADVPTRRVGVPAPRERNAGLQQGSSDVQDSSRQRLPGASTRGKKLNDVPEVKNIIPGIETSSKNPVTQNVKKTRNRKTVGMSGSGKPLNIAKNATATA
jgi:hypothetical protein